MLTDVTEHIVWREVAGTPVSMDQNTVVLKVEAAAVFWWSFKNWIIYSMFFFPESVLYRLVSDYNLIVWIPRCVYLLGQNTPVNPMRGTRCLWCLYFSAECDSVPSVFYHEFIPKWWSTLRLLPKSGFESWRLGARSCTVLFLRVSWELAGWACGIHCFSQLFLFLQCTGRTGPPLPS